MLVALASLTDAQNQNRMQKPDAETLMQQTVQQLVPVMTAVQIYMACKMDRREGRLQLG